MKTQTKIRIQKSRQPHLSEAVIEQLGDDESLPDIASHSADAGWNGFTYYKDTVAFFKANRRAICARLREDAQEFGIGTALEMLKGFNCLKGRWDADMEDSAMRCLSGAAITDADDTVANALAWYALEEIARELCPEA